MLRRAVFVLSVLVATSSFAQQSPFRVSAFVSSPQNGLGAAIEYRWAPRWALELAASSEKHKLTIGGIFNGHVIEFRTRPINLTVHYYFVNATRWQPYLGGGVRRVTSSSSEISDRTSAEVDGGLHFMVTPSFSVRLDGKGRIGSDNVSYDPDFKTSLGVSWRF